MDAVVAAIAKGKLRKLQTDNNHNPLWKKAIAAIHDIYLGKCPEKFTYKGKEYTPHSFFESTGLNPNDYHFINLVYPPSVLRTICP